MAEDGAKQKLSDYVGKGKVVLVDFWASWCPPCRAEIPKLQALKAKYGDKFDVLGVAVWDNPDDTRKAIEELNITWPVIIGTQQVDRAHRPVRHQGHSAHHHLRPRRHHPVTRPDW